MIDSIHIRLYRKNITDEQLSWFIKQLDPYTKKYRNFGVKIETDRILIWGSLPKYMLGNNVESITFSQAIEAIEKLSKETRLPLFDGELVRVDIAESFLVDENVMLYFANLMDTPGYQRNRVTTKLNRGVQYERGVTWLTFYNKTYDAYSVPNIKFSDFDKQGVIRIEYRVMKNIRRTVMNSSPGLHVDVIRRPAFQKRLAKQWCRHYEAILKKRYIAFPLSIKNTKALDTFLIASFLHNDRILSQTIDYIEAMAKRNKWTRQRKSDIKKSLMKKYKSVDVTIPTPYIQELDSKVRSGRIYAFAKA